MNNFIFPFSFELPTKIVYGPGCISTESNPRPMNKEDYLIVIKNAYSFII